MIKILPFFIEDEGLKCSFSISLVQNMGVLSKECAEVISVYMESCAVIDEWLSYIRDPITSRQIIPSRTWSDGVYVWDSTHIHYVKNYRVRLPGDFVHHVMKRVVHGFDFNTLNRDILRAEFERALEKIVTGDESCYADYGNNSGA